MTSRTINDRNHEISADGAIIGWVVKNTIGQKPGWYFIAAHKRFSNQYPDSVTPAPTWQAAVPRLSN